MSEQVDLASADDPQKTAGKLIRHSLWAGLAFAVVILVAVALEALSRFLVSAGLIMPDGVLDYAIHLGEYALVAIDVVLLVSVVGKLAWRLLRSQ